MSRLNEYYKAMKQYVKAAKRTGDKKLIKEVHNYLNKYREYGLHTGGENSYENLIYKKLVNEGMIGDAYELEKEKIINILHEIEGKLSTIEKDIKDHQPFFGEKYWTFNGARNSIKFIENLSHELNLCLKYVASRVYSQDNKELNVLHSRSVDVLQSAKKFVNDANNFYELIKRKSNEHHGKRDLARICLTARNIAGSFEGIFDEWLIITREELDKELGF